LLFIVRNNGRFLTEKRTGKAVSFCMAVANLFVSYKFLFPKENTVRIFADEKVAASMLSKSFSLE
jgi:hypothetical protein